MASDFNWPRPWLLDLYRQAVEQGCIRIVLRGETDEAREREYKSFRASFLRLRRKADAAHALQMKPEYALVTLRFEPVLGKVLISYNSLPDDQVLPAVEAVSSQQHIEQPRGSQPLPTPEESPDDFDPTQHVASLIDKIDLGDEEGPSEF